MTRALFLLVALGVAGCASASSIVTTATTSLADAEGHLQAAIDLYGISKGIAEVAALADPGLAPVLLATTATLDPLVSRARSDLAVARTAAVDTAAIEALAASITAQANALELAAAPVIKAVPSNG